MNFFKWLFGKKKSTPWGKHSLWAFGEDRKPRPPLDEDDIAASMFGGMGIPYAGKDRDKYDNPPKPKTNE